jgi:hypothetical protein
MSLELLFCPGSGSVVIATYGRHNGSGSSNFIRKWSRIRNPGCSASDPDSIASADPDLDRRKWSTAKDKLEPPSGCLIVLLQRFTVRRYSWR